MYRLNERLSIFTLEDICSNKDTLACWVASRSGRTQGYGSVYYHNGTITDTNGNVIDAGDYSYRYSGKDPINYVCFGSDEETCPDDNLYRIIGVFGNQVKLIKWDYTIFRTLGMDGDYYNMCKQSKYCYNKTSKGSNDALTLGLYYWNLDGVNTWSESKLNTVNLNTNFISKIGDKWASKIATTNWVVGGAYLGNIYSSKVAYINEITNPNGSIESTYSAKIGLMYVSDYGYASSSTYWTKNLYGTTNFKSYNWMYMGLTEYTITRLPSTNNGAYCIVGGSGYVGSCHVGNSETGGYLVRPVFYLNSDVTYKSGTGIKTNPYRINLD